ncbi:SET domain-containing protein SmydA-8 [Frankliniella occidentalis]|uniref:SET domain-containing protein SmydA-8 n=1 Tax=Frankliniella occidentalis TaxID=133901 RepID=A0A9C6UC51_FRAOC|nr:SET domain-containing protein SmydA-8 [Frankliniella occidentalis]
MEDHFTYGPRRGPCVVCGQAGTACARCRVAFYCGKEHQKQHWKLHKPTCGCLEVRADERVGRHIVAVKDIPMRTVLMRELPLVVYPGASTNPLEPTKLCVACCLKCNETVPCSHCGWPLCKRSCPYLDRHNIECAALKPKQAPVKCFSVTALHVLGVVRIWKTFEQEQGPRLLNLQHEMATPSPEYGTVEAANLKVAREGFRTAVSSAAAMASTMVACSRPETLKGLERASGAAILNGFVLMNEKCGSALYSGLSLLEHSCVPNARVIPDEDSDSDELLLIASRDIAAGEHVTIDYNYQRFPTLSERLRTNASRGFVCRCELCEDPTEKGTYFNAWCCTTCKSRDLKSLVTPVDAFGWQCRVCKSSGPSVDPAVRELEESFASLQASMALHPDPLGEDAQRLWQRFIDSAVWPKGPLHLTHHLVVKARAELLGQGDNRYPVRIPATLKEAGYLVEICKRLLDVAVALHPPIHGDWFEVKMFLFEFTMAKLMLQHRHGLQGNRRTVNCEIDKLKKELCALLAEIRHIAVTQFELKAVQRMEWLLRFV